MSSKVLLPTLSGDGWVNSSLKVADYLLSHFFLSDYSQTYFYEGYVASMPWIIQDTQGDMSKTCKVVQETLSTYFTRYFNDVVVEVTDVTDETNDPSRGQISIYLNFTDTENKQYTMAKLINIIDSKIKSIIDINNGV